MFKENVAYTTSQFISNAETVTFCILDTTNNNDLTYDL